jgi:hypothetical protein
VNIAQVIIYLFPQAKPLIDFTVQDDSDGNGPYIAVWNLEADQPTEEELEAAWEALNAFDIEAYKTTSLETLNIMCNATILGTFESSAMGEPHIYVFDYEAQMNLAGTKQAFTDGLITEIEWNTRDAGVLTHNQEQFNTLWLNGFQHKNSTINRFRTVVTDIQLAETKEDIDALLEAW